MISLKMPLQPKDALAMYCEPGPVGYLPFRFFGSEHDHIQMGQLCVTGPHESRRAMWSWPYSGGVVIARYIMRNPRQFAGKKLVDIGCGGGIVSVAAAKVGAEVTALDSSPAVTYIVKANADLNHVAVNAVCASLEDLCRSDDLGILKKAEILTAGDTFYPIGQAVRMAQMLTDLGRQGHTIYASSQDQDLGLLLPSRGLRCELFADDAFRRVSFVRLTP